MYQKLKEFWSPLTNAGISEDTPQKLKKSLRIINIAISLGFVVVIFFAFLTLAMGFPEMFILDCFLAIILVSSLLFNYVKYYMFAHVMAFYLTPIYLMYYPLYVGDIGTLYFNFVFLVVAFYTYEKKSHLLLYSWYIIVIFLYSSYALRTFEFDERYKVLDSVHYYPCAFSSAVMIILTVYIFKGDTIAYETKVEEQAEELNKQLVERQERELLLEQLLRELNHRVKNNLQMISSLFLMQSYNTKSQEVKKALEDARQRINAIAILHQNLYKRASYIQPNLRFFIEELCDYVIQAAGMDDEVIKDVQVDNIEIEIEKTVHVGLVVNELLTNSLKYGRTKNGKKSSIFIYIKKTDSNLVIQVKDFGPGFPEKYLKENSSSFGLELVEAIVTQYDGTMKIQNNEGANVLINIDIG